MTTRSTTYRRPRRDLVVRVQDDTVPGGPDATLVVGIVPHVCQFLVEAKDVQSCAEATRKLLTVQRWDQELRRWRGLTSPERDRFDRSLAEEAELQSIDEAEPTYTEDT